MERAPKRAEPWRESQVTQVQGVDVGKLKLLVIGVGFQAANVYLPTLSARAAEWAVELVGLVDFPGRYDGISPWRDAFGGTRPVDFIPAPARLHGSLYALSVEFSERLAAVVREYDVRAVIIATEPFSHAAYIDWALRHDLNILVDKPVTLRPWASIDVAAAFGIEDDYRALLRVAEHRRDRITGRPLVFDCMIQRRYHEAFADMRQMVGAVFDITGCPITSLVVMHNDGQFRLPAELQSIAYHGFDEGVGKLSHTGYHFLDLLPWLLTRCEPPELRIDGVRVQAQFVRPRDVAEILNVSNARRALLGTAAWKRVDAEHMTGYGEVDAHLLVTFCHGDIIVSSASLVLLHSGLSFRHWSDVSDDPLLNKGRMKQETIILHQGPFLSVQYHKYRATKGLESDHCDFGGEHHNEVNYLVNSPLLGGRWDRVIRKHFPHTLGAGNVPTYKTRCIEEFVRRVQGWDGPSGCESSNLASHAAGVRLLTGAYVAGARGYNGDAPVFRSAFSL
jgi:predicted dehydrogenase